MEIRFLLSRDSGFLTDRYRRTSRANKFPAGSLPAAERVLAFDSRDERRPVATLRNYMALIRRSLTRNPSANCIPSDNAARPAWNAHRDRPRTDIARYFHTHLTTPEIAQRPMNRGFSTFDGVLRGAGQGVFGIVCSRHVSAEE